MRDIRDYINRYNSLEIEGLYISDNNISDVSIILTENLFRYFFLAYIHQTDNYIDICLSYLKQIFHLEILDIQYFDKVRLLNILHFNEYNDVEQNQIYKAIDIINIIQKMLPIFLKKRNETDAVVLILNWLK